MPRKEDGYERSWCFTSYSAEAPVFGKNMRYLLYAPEVCPDTKRNHWQCYVVFKNHRTITAIQKEAKKKTGKSFGHLEAAKGGLDHQLSYIQGPYSDGKGKTKPFNPEWREFGKRPRAGQGKRNDLDELKDALTLGETTVDEITIANPMMFHKYGRTLSKIEDLVLRKRVRTWMTTCEWYHGPTGVGKSHRAFDGFDPDTHYVWKDDNGWQDGYTGQETVIINDFRGAIRYDQMLQLIDKWPYWVRRRGREPAPFLAKHVIITSSLAPEQVYNRRAEGDEIAQLLRRIKVTHIDTPYKETAGGPPAASIQSESLTRPVGAAAPRPPAHACGVCLGSGAGLHVEGLTHDQREEWNALTGDDLSPQEGSPSHRGIVQRSHT